MKRSSSLQFSEAISIAASSLWAHKLRSVLTLAHRGGHRRRRRHHRGQPHQRRQSTLSAVGGIIGVVFGGGLSLLLRYGVHFPAVLSLFWVVTALGMCALIGVGFGVYPAWKAARLDPVEALCYE
jgi:hypothetical protein